MSASNRASNKRIGDALVAQLRLLKRESERAGTVEHSGKRVSRAWIRERLGCGADFLSSNTTARAILKKWDKAPPRGTVEKAPTQSTKQDGDNEATVRQFRRKRAPLEDRLIWSKLVVGAITLDIPSVVRGNKFDETCSDWLRDLAVEDLLTKGTLEEYIKAYRLYEKFRKRSKVEYDRASDSHLLEFRASLLARTITVGRVNDCMSRVHSLYRHLEKRRTIHMRVQIYHANELPLGLAHDFHFAISSKIIIRRSKEGGVTQTWGSPFLIPESVADQEPRPTPTDNHMKQAMSKARSQKHGVRNRLLLSLAEETGGRISEILQIKISQLPPIEHLEELEETDGTWPIQVKRKKRRRPGYLYLNRYLLKRIFVYVAKERRDVVNRFPEVSSCIDELFLSDRGTPLQADSVTHLVIELFDGILERAGIHRLRSKFAVDELEKLFETALEKGLEVGPNSSWIETFLTILSNKMGQASIKSLRPYLPIVFGQRLSRTKTATALELDLRIQEQNRLIEEQLDRLREFDVLLNVASLLAMKKKLEAADAMFAAAEEIRSEAAA